MDVDLLVFIPSSPSSFIVSDDGAQLFERYIDTFATHRERILCSASFSGSDGQWYDCTQASRQAGKEGGMANLWLNDAVAASWFSFVKHQHAIKNVDPSDN